jgi:hypothetical protein
MTDREYGTSRLEEDDDDKELESLGYVPSFKREFSNLATVRCLYFPFPTRLHFLMDDSHFAQISFAFSIMVCSPLPLPP